MSPRPPRSRRWWAVTLLLAGASLGLGLVVLARFAPFQMPFPICAAESEAFWVLLPSYLLAAACLREKRNRFATAPNPEPRGEGFIPMDLLRDRFWAVCWG